MNEKHTQSAFVRFVYTRFHALLIVIIIVMVVFGFTVLLLPTYMSIRDVHARAFEEAFRQLAFKKQERDRLVSVNRQLSRVTAADLHRIETILPSKKDIPSLFLEMQKLAEDSGFSLRTISVSDADTKQSTKKEQENSPTENISSFSISLSIAGDTEYQSIKRFLDAVEKNIRILDIESFSYGGTKPQGRQTQSTKEALYTVTMKTYVAP